MEVDVSHLRPEVRPIVREVATVYLEHTEPWFIGLVVHGSAVKGGVIPSCYALAECVSLYLRCRCLLA